MVHVPLKGIHDIKVKSSQTWRHKYFFFFQIVTNIRWNIYIKSNLQRLPQSAPHCQHRHKRLHNGPTYANPKTKLFFFYSFFIQMVSDDFPWLFIWRKDRMKLFANIMISPLILLQTLPLWVGALVANFISVLANCQLYSSTVVQ